MLRKIMAVVITFILFIGIITPVGYAEVKSSILTKVEIEKLAREKLSLYKDYKLQYSNLYTSDIQQRQFWNLNFEGNKNNTSMVMDAESGVIISINQWYSESYGRAITLLEDDAKKISIDFIKSLETERFKQTEEVTLKSPTIIPFDTKINYTDSDNYHFMFVRKINGEFFPNNYFSVTVSGINGSVISYEMKWDDATYVENKMLLSERRVRDIFGKEDRLKLKYVKLNKYNQQDDKNIILTPVYVYAPKETDKINATNGKLLTFNELYNFGYYGYPIYGDDSFSENEMMDKTASNEVVEMIPEEGVISKEAAEQIIIKMLKEHVNIDGIKLNSTRYTNYYGGIKGKFWSVYWYSNEGSKYLNSVINAENGEVLNISYNKNEGYEPISEMRILEKNVINKENTIKNDDILKIANEKIQTIFPKIKDNLNLEVKSDNIKDEDEVYLSSSRYIDNIPFEDNYVNMRYNTKTKEITSLNYRWYDVEVQNDSSILNEKKAHKIFYDKVGFEKYLVQLKDLEKCKIEGLELPKEELLPVYGLKDFGFNYVDALNGKFLNYSGEEYKEDQKKISQFTDVKDSPYKKDIMLMDKMGILKVIDETFKPDEALLRKDALKWIIETGWSNKAYSVDKYHSDNNENTKKDYFKDMSKENPYYKYIQVGVEFGIVNRGDYFKPDEKISKLELTKWIINAMKQKELAEYSSIFQIPYKDNESIKAEDTGYVALAKYYNIFEDKNIEADFEPSKSINRGKFIKFMYKFIKGYKNMNI